MKFNRSSDCHRWLCIVLSLAVALASGGCASRTSDSVPLARKQLWEVFFNRGDAAAVAQLYSTNGELVMSGTPPIRGRTAIRDALAKMVQSREKVSIDVERSAEADGLAYFYGSYRVLTNQKMVERGTYLEVWHRSDGEWSLDLDVNASAPIGPSSSQ